MTAYVSGGLNLITLRDDYGSTWHGDIIIKDVTMVSTAKTSTFYLILATHHNHDFGYPTYMPTNVIVDNFVCEGASTVNVFRGNVCDPRDYSGDTLDSVENLNLYTPTKSVTVKNNNKGYVYTIPDTPFFMNTTLTAE